MNCQILKSNFRKQKLMQRLSLEKEEVELKSRQICLQAFTNFFLVNKKIGLYIPYKNEVNPLFLLKYGVGVTSLPFVFEKQMVFKKWQEGDELVKSSFGLQSPVETSINIIPEIIIVPLLAFDSKKYRIGYGGGYYDKYLSTFSGLTIGFAYDFQIVDKIPREAFDINLDGIVTETKIFL